MVQRHVLVVDDNPDDATYLAHMLGYLLNHQVTSASDGQQALDLAHERQFDLVITDLNMPTMSGIDLAAALRKLEPYRNTPIIAITAYDTASDQLRTLRAGCNLYLTKPVSIDRLTAAVSQYLPS